MLRCTWRKGYEKEKLHLLKKIVAPLETVLRGELGDDLEPWTNHNETSESRYSAVRRNSSSSMTYENAEYSAAYGCSGCASITWISLVSTLYPRIQRMLLAGS